MMNPTLKSMLLANIDIEEYDPIYRKTILLNLILMTTVLGFGVFTIINYFIIGQVLVGVFYFISFIIAVFAIFHIRKTQTIKLASYITSYNLLIFIFLLISTYP